MGGECWGMHEYLIPSDLCAEMNHGYVRKLLCAIYHVHVGRALHRITFQV